VEPAVKKQMISFYVTPEQYQEIKQKAEQEDRSISTYVKRCVLPRDKSDDE
jgi:hypothetical protein